VECLEQDASNKLNIAKAYSSVFLKSWPIKKKWTQLKALKELSYLKHIFKTRLKRI